MVGPREPEVAIARQCFIEYGQRDQKPDAERQRNNENRVRSVDTRRFVRGHHRPARDIEIRVQRKEQPNHGDVRPQMPDIFPEDVKELSHRLLLAASATKISRSDIGRAVISPASVNAERISSGVRSGSNLLSMNRTREGECSTRSQ